MVNYKGQLYWKRQSFKMATINLSLFRKINNILRQRIIIYLGKFLK